MRITLLTKHVELGDSLRSFIEGKFSLLSKQLRRIEKEGSDLLLRIEIARTTRHHKKGEVYYIEATLQLPGKLLRIEQYDENIRKGVAAAKNRLKEVIIEHIEKEQQIDQKKIRSKKSMT